MTRANFTSHLKIHYSLQWAKDHPDIAKKDNNPHDQFFDRFELMSLTKKERELLIRDEKNRAFAHQIRRLPFVAKPITVLRGATVPDFSKFGKSSQDLADSTIVIQDGKILAIGPRKKIPIPKNTQIIDVTGKTITPGLVDSFAWLHTQGEACAHLYMGVTSVVGIMGDPLDKADLYFNANPSPRLYPLAYWEVGFKDIQTPLPEKEALKSLDKAAREGAKVVILYYPIAPKLAEAFVKRARELEMIVIGELGETPYFWAIEHGIKTLIHTTRYMRPLASETVQKQIAADPFGELSKDFSSALFKTFGVADPIPSEVTKLKEYAAKVAQENVTLIPTLAYHYGHLPNSLDPWSSIVATLIQMDEMANYADYAKVGKVNNPQRARAIIKMESEFYSAGAHYLAASGGTLPALGTLAGFSLHAELYMYTLIGLTPREAIAAATGNIRQLWGWNEIGAIVPGAQADLLVLEENPVDNLENLKKIEKIYLNGKLIERESLLQCRK